MADAIGDVLREADRRIVAEESARPEDWGMGTSALVCALVGGRWLAGAHVGNARLYLGSPGEWRQATVDHTISEYYRRAGQPPWAANAAMVFDKALTSVLGAGGATQVDRICLDVGNTRRVLLATDGAYRSATERVFDAVFREASPEAAGQRLLDAWADAGRADHATVVVVDV